MPLELRGPANGLIDDPYDFALRGAGPDVEVRWRARIRDDDDRVWRAAAERPEQLATAWSPAKASTGPLAALHSLRPVALDVNAELADGRSVTRTVTRRFLDDGARIRRWRDDVVGALHLPAGDVCATVLVDATAAGSDAAGLVAPLLASRGVLVLVVTGGRGNDPVAAARDLLGQVPLAAGPPEALDPAELPLPPGIPAVEGGADRAERWDALLTGLGARARL